MPKLGLRSWDIALAAVAAAALVAEGLLTRAGAMSPGAYVLAIVAAAPLTWRARAPLAALIAIEAGALLCVVAFHANWAAIAMVLVELYTVALLGDRQRSLVVGTVTALAVVFAIVLIDGTVDLGGIAMRVPLVFVALGFGDTIRSRRALRAAAEERAEVQDREHEEELRRRASAERLRIARELHDTLAHFLVAINVRSSVALDLPDSQDPSEALRDIKQASATALRDLRATLNLLRDHDDVAPRSPALDLAALPGLVERARSAGLRADIDVQVNGTVVPTVIGEAAFRIVQEALTNVLRHAHASAAQVRVAAGTEALDIEITDDGVASNGDRSADHGLRGMAERAEALGGQIDAGPRREGGWRVHAVLPLRVHERR
jgi:signal transduction histidine kinase